MIGSLFTFLIYWSHPKPLLTIKNASDLASLHKVFKSAVCFIPVINLYLSPCKTTSQSLSVWSLRSGNKEEHKDKVSLAGISLSVEISQREWTDKMTNKRYLEPHRKKKCTVWSHSPLQWTQITHVGGCTVWWLALWLTPTTWALLYEGSLYLQCNSCVA